MRCSLLLLALTGLQCVSRQSAPVERPAGARLASRPAASAPARREGAVIVRRTCDCWFNQVYFAASSALTQDHQRRGIEDNIGCLRGCGRHRQLIELVGHTDDQERDPDALGLARAVAVKRFFAARGFPEARIQVRSLGVRRPARPGQSATDREHNRRVELRVLSWPTDGP